ncbi:transposase [Streptomyces sp. NRRL F-2580]|uniref:transposase n=1 Tax=Streptomyces sp. NRRL F-2580 TaxID=1463841 RepID=UPI003B63AE46
MRTADLRGTAVRVDPSLILVDVESRRPVDLLPDREASSLAAWLAKRPAIEVVCRDRAPFFAEGATVGAPQAVQVADRWHLWHNLSEAAERCVSDDRGRLRVLAPNPAQPAPDPIRSKTRPARLDPPATASQTAAAPSTRPSTKLKSTFQSAMPAAQPSIAVRTFSWDTVRV